MPIQRQSKPLSTSTVARRTPVQESKTNKQTRSVNREDQRTPIRKYKTNKQTRRVYREDRTHLSIRKSIITWVGGTTSRERSTRKRSASTTCHQLKMQPVDVFSVISSLEIIMSSSRKRVLKSGFPSASAALSAMALKKRHIDKPRSNLQDSQAYGTIKAKQKTRRTRLRILRIRDLILDFLGQYVLKHTHTHLKNFDAYILSR